MTNRRLLLTTTPPPILERYILPISGPTGSIELSNVCDRMFRIDRVKTSVDAPGRGNITNILFNGEPQLIPGASIDLYEWSIQLEKHLEQEFLRIHQLTDRSDEEIQSWLDDHDLELPKTGRVMLPTLKPNTTVTVRGCLNTTPGVEIFAISFWGTAVKDSTE